MRWLRGRTRSGEDLAPGAIVVARDRLGRVRPLTAVGNELRSRHGRVLVVVGQALDDVLRYLARVVHEAEVDLGDRYDVVVGWTGIEADAEVGLLLRALPDELIGAGQTVDAVAVGPCALELLPGLRPDRLVLIGVERSAANGPWPRTLTVQLVNPVGLQGPTVASDRLFVPAPGLAPSALLGLPPVARWVGSWLSGAPAGGAPGSEPWRERDLRVLPGHVTVGWARARCEAAHRSWAIVVDQGLVEGDSVVVATTGELVSRLRSVDPATELRRVAALADCRAPIVGARTAPPWSELADGFADPSTAAPRRLLAVHDGVAVAVVPSITDGVVTDPPTAGGDPTEPSVREAEAAGAGDRTWLASRDRPDRADGRSGSGRPGAGVAWAGSLPSTVVRRSLEATAPTCLAVGEEHEVRVVVTDPDSAGGDVLAARAATVITPGAPLELHARARGGVELVGSAIHTVPCPDLRPIEHRFAMRGVQRGPASVTIGMRQSGDELAAVALPVEVGPRSAGDQRADALARAAPEPMPRPQLRLYREGVDGLLCEFADPTTGAVLVEHFEPRDGWRARVTAALRLVASMEPLRSTHGGALTRELVGIGQQLRRELLPTPIADVLWEHRSALDSLELTTDEPYVPWELCGVAGPGGEWDHRHAHLGQGGLVRRWPYSVSVPRLRLGRGRRLIVAPGYDRLGRKLPAQAEEARMMIDRFGARPMPTDLPSLLGVVDDGAFDLLHFAGHGWSTPDELDRSMLLLDDSAFVDDEPRGGFTPYMIGRLAPDPGVGPLVFLNACQSGLLGPGLGGFPGAFLRAGAAVFVGSQWPIDDQAAARFAEAFYEGLLSSGSTLAAAVREARISGGLGAGSASALAYAVYGDPMARDTVTTP